MDVLDNVIAIKFVNEKVKKIILNLHELNMIEILKKDISEPQKKSLATFQGLLSENEYSALKEHTEQARKEWD